MERERSINFDYGIADILAEHRLGVVMKTKETANWTAKGLKSVSKAEIAQAFLEDKDLRESVGSSHDGD